MPHRTTLAVLLALALAGCASGAGAESAAPDSSGDPAVDAPVGSGIRAGWISFKTAEKRGQILSQTLVGESTREGKLIMAGKGRIDGGKAVSDKDMADFVKSVDEATDFAKYAVQCDPNTPPAGALAVAWIDRGTGNGFESLFLMPGAVKDSSTAGAPKAYQAVKVLIMGIHQATPGSSVRVGTGWSGEDLLNQKPGDTHR